MLVMNPSDLIRLMDEHAAALALYARQWTAAPEDVVQEAFARLARLNAPPQNVAAWLYRVVRNGAISVSRSEARRKRHEIARAAEAPTWFVADPAGELDAEAVANALAALPADLREPVVLHLWGGQTFVQIAELIGQSASTAHRRYLEGLATLRERLGVVCPKT